MHNIFFVTIGHDPILSQCHTSLVGEVGDPDSGVLVEENQTGAVLHMVAEFNQYRSIKPQTVSLVTGVHDCTVCMTVVIFFIDKMICMYSSIKELVVTQTPN